MRFGIIWSCLVLQGFAVDSTDPLAAPQSDAADAPKSAQSVTAADYGPAFERLIQLGLPDTKGATYVKLSLHGKGAQELETQGYAQRESFGASLKTKGNAWLLPSTKESEAKAQKGSSNFIYRSFEKVRVQQKERRGGLARLLLGKQKPPKGDSEALLGEWSEVDVSVDAKKILSKIEKHREDGKFFEASRWNYDNSKAQWCAQVLITACQMYRAGHHDEANQIAERLMSLAPEPVVVIDQVVNHLANTEYQLLVHAFLKSKDWKAYQTGTKQLVDRFSRGWKSREGAELLLVHLDNRIKGVKPELKALKGVTIKPEALKIMDGWLDQTEPIIVNPPQCWLLGMNLAPANTYSYDGSPASNNDPQWMKTLGGMGMDGFIALTAAAADDSLIATTIGLGTANYYGGYSNYSSSGNISPARTQYAAMTRPCSRGEIARKVILKTLPDSENELSALPSAELQSVAYQWWLQHRSDSSSALAKHFLETGNAGQKIIAVTALIQSNDDIDAKIVETYILGSENISQQHSTVEMYLKARRSKAKSFFAAYSKALKDEVGEADKDNYQNWHIKQAGGVDKYLKKFSVYVDDISAEKIIADMRKGKLKPKEGMDMFSSVMEAGTFSQHLPELVTIARKLKDPKDLTAMVEALTNRASKERRHFKTEKKESEYVASLPAQFEKSKADWLSLMDEKIQLPKNNFSFNPTNQAEIVAWTIETIYFPKNQEIIWQLYQVAGVERTRQILVDHIKQVITDGADADFPNPDKVKEAEREKIRKDISSLKPQEIGEYYEKLSLNEKLAWSEILDGFGDKVPDGVKKMKTMIMKIKWSEVPDIDNSIKKKITELTKYQVLDQKLAESMMNLMFEHAEATASFALVLHSENGHQLALNVWGGRAWQSSKKYFLQSALKVMDDGKISKCAGVTRMGGSEATAIRTSLEKDKEITKEALSKLVKEMLTSIDEKGSFRLIFFSETQENIKKTKEEEAKKSEDDEGLLPGGLLPGGLFLER